MKSSSLFWVGVDWGNQTHAVHAFCPANEARQTFTVSHTREGLDELVAQLKALGEVGGVAVETVRNPLILKLFEAGFVVYLVNPALSHSWRKSNRVSQSKSDSSDARMLAEGLWHHHDHVPQFHLSDEKRAEMNQLCQDEVHFIAQRTKLVLELQGVLKQYFPYMLTFFTDWSSRTAWDFVAAFPDPEALANASSKKLFGFLARHHIGASPLWQKRVEDRAQALQWPCDGARTRALALRVQSIVAMLRPLELQLKEYRKRIDALFAQMEDADLFRSLPGAGQKLAPRLCSMFDEKQPESESPKTLRQLAGVAPVTLQSGKSKNVIIRRSCRKVWRHHVHLYAQLSMRKCRWANAYYYLCRERGDSFATALRKLAGKWINIIYRMWKTKTPYDDKLYVEQLKAKNSPTYQFMCKMEGVA